MARYLVYTDAGADAANLEERLAPILGWASPAGVGTRAAFDPATVTTEELAERVKALIDDLIARGWLSTDPDPYALTTIEISPTGPLILSLS